MSASPVQAGAMFQEQVPTRKALSRGFRLGDWWVHPEDGQLTREDVRQRLSPLQMDLLVFLARHGGKVIPKEELFAEVWRGAAVEDGALPRCISEIRGALGDRAQDPAYIETIPRRGYRLLAKVRLGEDASGPADRLPRKTRMTSAGVVFAAIALSVLVLLAGQRRAGNAMPGPALADPAGAANLRGTTAVLGFKNLSGKREHAWLSTALSEVLASELALSPELRAIPAKTVSRAKRELSIVDAETPSVETRRRIRTSLGAGRIVFGSYLAVDGEGEEQLRIDLWVEDTDSGATVATMVERGKKSDLLELVTLLGIRLREELGIDGSSSRATNAPRPEVPRRPATNRLQGEDSCELRRCRTHRAHRFATLEEIRSKGDGPPEDPCREALSARCYESLARAVALEGQTWSGGARLGLGNSALEVEAGSLGAAARAFAGAKEIWSESEDPGQLALTLEVLAVIAAEKNDWEAAGSLLERAILLMQEMDGPGGLV